MKYKLKDRDVRLIQSIQETTDTNYEVDNEGYVEVECLISALSDLKDMYDKQEKKLNKYEKKENEDRRLHYIDEQINKGMHPHEYE